MNNRADDRIEVALDLLSKGNSPSATVTRVAHGWGERLALGGLPSERSRLPTTRCVRTMSKAIVIAVP